MIHEHRKLAESRRLRLFLLLTFFYFSQVYPFYHLHHTHDEGSFGFEISSHFIDHDDEHSTSHHHEDDSAHSDSHHHAYDQHVEWHIIRAQNLRFQSDLHYHPVSSNLYIPCDGDNFAALGLQVPSCDDDYHSESIPVRGPPPPFQILV